MRALGTGTLDAMSRRTQAAVEQEMLRIVERHPGGVCAMAAYEASELAMSLAQATLALRAVTATGAIRYDETTRCYLPARPGEASGTGTAPRGRGGLPRGAVRLQLLRGLVRPMTTAELVVASRLTPKQVSNHLYFLRVDGYVTSAGDGRGKHWRRTPAGDALAEGAK